MISIPYRRSWSYWKILSDTSIKFFRSISSCSYNYKSL